MRHAALVIASIALALGASAAVAADRRAVPACLSSGDTTEAVASHEIVAPRDAIRTARRAVPNAEVLRAALCRRGEALVYIVLLLQRDGRVARLEVDARSGHTARID